VINAPCWFVVKVIVPVDAGVADVVDVTLLYPNPELPDEPDEPLEPELPDVPLVPEEPLEPDEPEEPELPEEPLVPAVPDEPLEPDVPAVPLVPEVAAVYDVPFINNEPVIYALLVTLNEPVTSVFVKCLIVVPSSEVFESFKWKPFTILGTLFVVKLVSPPILFNVSGPVIIIDDVTDEPDVT
jgi:hypothetical protein